MTRLDDKLVDKVFDTVEKFGRVATFHEVCSATPDPKTGRVTKSDPIQHKRKVTPRADYDTRYIDGATIRVGDTSVIVAAKGLVFTPVVGMKVTIGAEDWKIMSVRYLDPGEKTAGYQLHLRT